MGDATPSAARDYYSMTKPRIVLMSVLTAVAGTVISGQQVGLLAWIGVVVGTALIVASASVLNMYLERDTDGLMPRTSQRPLPQKRVSDGGALVWGFLLAFAATPLLTFAVSPLAGLLGAVAFVLYVNVYTPMKRSSSWSTVVGAIPGAIPVLIGGAVDGSISVSVFSVFALLAVWQLPHFYAIAMYRHKEYARAGMITLQKVVGPKWLRWCITFWAGVQLASSVWVYLSGAAGIYYLVVALLLGSAYLAYSVYGSLTKQGPAWAKRVFLLSIIYLPVVMIGLVANAGV